MRFKRKKNCAMGNVMKKTISEIIRGKHKEYHASFCASSRQRNEINNRKREICERMDKEESAIIARQTFKFKPNEEDIKEIK